MGGKTYPIPQEEKLRNEVAIDCGLQKVTSHDVINTFDTNLMWHDGTYMIHMF